MQRRLGSVLVPIVLLSPFLLSGAEVELAPKRLVIGRGERLLVVAPHPDDETLGAGGLIQRVRTQGGSVRVLLVTAGDGYVKGVVDETGVPRPKPSQYIAYGERRLREVRAALRQLAADHVRLQILGFPDGGIHGLLYAHWWRTQPERSPTTAVSDPPYDAEVSDPDVPYDGDDLRREIEDVLREEKPTIIVLPDPLDKHPDHSAVGLFTVLAINDWLGQGHKLRAARPRILAYLVHWPDWPPDWSSGTPNPNGPDEPLELPDELRAGEQRTALTLSDAELENKRAALAKHVSQQKEMGSFLAAFMRRTEPFSTLDEQDLRRVGLLIEARPQVPRYGH